MARPNRSTISPQSENVLTVAALGLAEIYTTGSLTRPALPAEVDVVRVAEVKPKDDQSVAHVDQ
jgi:hypothetical protein